MPYGQRETAAAFPGLLGANLQTAPRREAPIFSPVISEESYSGESCSSGEYAVGSMDFDDAELARLKKYRMQVHSASTQMLHDEMSWKGSASRTPNTNDSPYKRCSRCNLWVHSKDRALHSKGCPTHGTSPVTASRDEDYYHITPHSADPYLNRGRSRRPSSRQPSQPSPPVSHNYAQSGPPRIENPLLRSVQSPPRYQGASPFFSPAPPYTFEPPSYSPMPTTNYYPSSSTALPPITRPHSTHPYQSRMRPALPTPLSYNSAAEWPLPRPCNGRNFGH